MRLVYTNIQCPVCPNGKIRLWFTPSGYDDDGHAHEEEWEVECPMCHAEQFEDVFLDSIDDWVQRTEGKLVETGVIQEMF